jgi:hypothetical protein
MLRLKQNKFYDTGIITTVSFTFKWLWLTFHQSWTRTGVFSHFSRANTRLPARVTRVAPGLLPMATQLAALSLHEYGWASLPRPEVCTVPHHRKKMNFQLFLLLHTYPEYMIHNRYPKVSEFVYAFRSYTGLQGMHPIP